MIVQAFERDQASGCVVSFSQSCVKLSIIFHRHQIYKIIEFEQRTNTFSLKYFILEHFIFTVVFNYLASNKSQLLFFGFLIEQPLKQSINVLFVSYLSTLDSDHRKHDESINQAAADLESGSGTEIGWRARAKRSWR